MSALFRASKTADFDSLYQRHAASVYRYAYAVVGNHADAEDVTQQTFLNAYRAMTQGTKPRKAENWLLTIAHNEVRRHWRSRYGKSREVEFDEQFADAAPERADPSIADVVRALQQLPPIQRSALVMREFEGRSYSEIAQVLNVTQSALEALLFRARRALAEELEDALTCAEAELALSRRLDGRLPRRERRRLKAHLRECALCARFDHVQRRQRSLLDGLSVLPVPASLYLVRGESAAAAVGLGAAGAAGGSAAIGGGAAVAGAGGAGIAAGVVAKAAAITAAAAVAGGVGYGVGTRPEAVTSADGKVDHAAAVAQTRGGRRAADVREARTRSSLPGLARPAIVRAHAPRKAIKVKSRPANAAPRANKAKSTERAAVGPIRARKQAASVVKAPRTKPAAAELAVLRPRTRPENGKRIERRAHPTPSPPARAVAKAKPKPPRGAVTAPPAETVGPGPKKQGDAEG